MLYKRNTIITLVVFIVMMFAGSKAVNAEDQSQITNRLYGVDRYSTNMDVVNYGWTGHSEYAVIVSGENFPDAICSTSLSAKYNAPLFLTAGDTLNAQIKDKLEELGVKKVFLIGGTGVMSDGIKDELMQKDIDVERLGGSTRIETSIEIAKKVEENKLGDELFVASSEGFADALSVSAYAAGKAEPVLLTPSSGEPEELKNYVSTLKPSKTYIIGGQAVMPDSVASCFENYERLGGIDRYETNAQILNKFYDLSNTNKIYIAAGINYPDALSISPLAARDNSPLVLAGDNMSENQVKMVRDNRNTLKERIVVGGESVVPDYLVDRLFADSDDITPENFINSYNGQLPSDELSAFKNLALGFSLYPNDSSLKSAFDEGASHLLDSAVKIHNGGNYDKALDIYNYLLQLKVQLPVEVKTNATVFRNVALSKNPIASRYVYKESSQAIVQNALEEYSKLNFNFDNPIKYSAMQEYLNFSTNDHFTTDKPDSLTFDENGIPMVIYREFGTQYNYVTICQYALYLHAKYLQGDTSAVNQFIKCADFLVDHMDSDGSFRYKFPYYSYESLGMDWTSSMSQGEALNVFSRAYEITGDSKYITAGNKAFNYLITPVSSGGVMDTLGSFEPKFKNDIFFEEYVNTIPSYTLNGYMFTLLGIYDWSQLARQVSSIDGSKADYYFNEGIKSLKIILPYYDIGGFTSYDLVHLMTSRDANPALDYHKVHIDLLEAIYSITGDEYFMDMRNQWVNYISFTQKN